MIRMAARYYLGKGLTVFVDAKKVNLLQSHGRQQVVIGSAVIENAARIPANYALNILHNGYPLPTASVNSIPDTSLYQAIDGRIWYFPEITNRWTTLGSTSSTDWFAVDFGQAHTISMVKIYLYTDSVTFASPDGITIQYKNSGQWLPVKLKKNNPGKITGNTVNTMAFDKVTATQLRIHFKHTTKQVAVSEIECY